MPWGLGLAETRRQGLRLSEQCNQTLGLSAPPEGRAHGEPHVDARARRLADFRQMSERLQRDLIELDSLVVDEEVGGALAGLACVPDDLVPDLAAREMVGELLGALLEAAGVDLFDHGADERVEPAALGLEERGVGDVLRERVPEDVLELIEAGLFVDQLDPLQLGEALLELILEVGHPAEEREAELPPDHRGGLHRALLRLGEPVEPRGDDVLDGVGHADRRDGLREDQPPVLRPYRAGLREGPADLLEEERVALGLARDRHRELARQLGDAECGAHDARGVLLVHRLEPDAPVVGAVAERLLVRGPVRDDQEHGHPGQALGQRF